MQQQVSELQMSYKGFQMSAKGSLLTGQLQHDSGSPLAPMYLTGSSASQLLSIPNWPQSHIQA